MNIKKMKRIILNENGYLLITVTIIGIVLSIIFGNVLPKIYFGQTRRALLTLNEYRAQEAARKSIEAVKSGIININNVEDLINSIPASIESLCGLNNHFVYYNNEGEPIFVSGCMEMSYTPTAFSQYNFGFDLAVLIADPDTESISECKSVKSYLFKKGLSSLSQISVSDKYEYTKFSSKDSYCDYYFDFDNNIVNINTDKNNADFLFRFDIINKKCSISIGNNGNWNQEESSNEQDVPIWNFESHEIESKTAFVVIRSIGITVAAKSNYNLDNTALGPIKPMPYPQMIETGFSINDADVLQIYFSVNNW